jgi:hypothetical protein
MDLNIKYFLLKTPISDQISFHCFAAQASRYPILLSNHPDLMAYVTHGWMRTPCGTCVTVVQCILCADPCRYCSQPDVNSSQCRVCGATADLWICLICGHVVCMCACVSVCACACVCMCVCVFVSLHVCVCVTPTSKPKPTLMVGLRIMSCIKSSLHIKQAVSRQIHRLLLALTQQRARCILSHV